MKKLLQFIFFLLAAGVFFTSCRRNNNDKLYHVLSIECESMVPQCGNGPGLRFTGEKFGMWMEPSGKRGDFERVTYHHTVCCEYVPGLIDTLKKAQALRLKNLEEKPDLAEKTYVLLDGTRVKVYYNKHYIDDKEFSNLWFGDEQHGRGFYINLKDFDDLLEDIEERFRTCCLE